MIVTTISATALARLACKSVLFALGFLPLALVLGVFLRFWCFRGSRIPPVTYRVRPPPHQEPSLDRPKPIVSVPEPLKINIFCPRTTKTQYFLSPDRQKPNFFLSRTTKNQYFLSPTTKNQCFLSPDHQKQIFSIPGPLKTNIF